MNTAGRDRQQPQWTVTGAGCAVVKNKGSGIKIPAVSIGTICDLGITDANNMGAAMAPAAEKTIYDFLCDTNTAPQDYDMILTGDLGSTGSKLLYELLEKEHGLDIREVHYDCGLMIFDLEEQDVNSGGFRMRMQRVRSVFSYFKTDALRQSEESAVCCNGRVNVSHIQQAGSAYSGHCPRCAFGGVVWILKTILKLWALFRKL